MCGFPAFHGLLNNSVGTLQQRQGAPEHQGCRHALGVRQYGGNQVIDDVQAVAGLRMVGQKLLPALRGTRLPTLPIVHRQISGTERFCQASQRMPVLLQYPQGFGRLQYLAGVILRRQVPIAIRPCIPSLR